MRQYITILLLTSMAVLSAPTVATVQEMPEPIEERVSHLETRVEWLGHEVRRFADEGVMLVLFGAFCALWAQNTRRNPWLWFFLGTLFSFVTVIFLLVKNSKDRRA